MVKFLTKHTHQESFFQELKENEVFMYAYHDFRKEDVVEISKKHKVNIECILKGTEDYKLYGECAVKVTKLENKVYEFKIKSGETIKIEAQTEVNARLKLFDELFNMGYVKVRTY